VEQVEVDTTKRIILQVFNVLAILGVPVSSTLTYLVVPTLSEQGDNERLISPAGWAFSIWGLIYSLLTGFTVYQALPANWVENRNDDLIYNYLAWGWLINMVSQWIWFPTFSSNTGWGFIISSIDILVMIGSALYMEFMSNRAEVNWAEWIFIRGGLSIYCGWLTAATILNITALLKFYEFEGFDWYSEEAITITILYVAWLIYTLATYIELKPLYGGVFIWVCLAISSEI
jgi:translocator protein